MKSRKNVSPTIITAFFFLFATISILIFFWKKLPPQVPLFYSRPWGQEQLGTPLDLFIFPGSSTIIALWTFISSQILKEEELLLQITTTGAALFCFLSFFALSRIIILTI